MRAPKSRAALWVVLFLLLSADRASALSQNSRALVVLTNLVERAGNEKSFGEFPAILSAYLAAKTELGASPKVEDLLAAKSQLLDMGVGQAEKEQPAVAQQTGATADSVGTTTLAEKPGIADLINLAIERGAIIKTTSGTSFTLQTTPYMIYSQFGARDTEETWNKLEVLRQIGISATFNQSDGADVPKNDNFESGELKYTRGNRSPRDKAFLDDLWNQMGPALASFYASEKSLHRFENSLPEPAKQQFLNNEVTFEQWFPQQPKPIPADQILAELGALFKDFKLEEKDEFNLKDLVDKLDQEANALAAASEVVKNATKAYLEAPHPQFSLAYIYQRDVEVSDFSTLKGLFGYQTEGKLSANLNGEVMFNNHRTDAAGLAIDRIRAYSVEAGLTLGKFANDALDFTAGAKWMRPQGESRDIRSFQAKLNLYLTHGVTIPFSLTYANGTEDASTPESGRSRVRLNVGFALTGDALMGVARRTP